MALGIKKSCQKVIFVVYFIKNFFLGDENMKIEMGESLFLSWLRHVKQCQIVQLNWKPSNSWEMSNEDKIEDLIQIYRKFIKSKHNRELFGKKDGQSPSQIIRQSEIDALGFELSGNKISSAYAIDVAFHEAGLNYGTREETVCRVIKKLVRTAMIMLGYFSVDDGEIIFASPKISPKVFSELNEIIQLASDIAKSNNLKFKFRLLANENFRDKVGIPVPAFMTALACYDGYRHARLPANLLQAQRDYFGAHTYKRVDKEGTFHSEWLELRRPVSEVTQ